MLRPNEWSFFVKTEELPVSGFFAITITDDVLDPDCWPIANIVITGGKVSTYMPLFNSAVYDLPDMTGWTAAQVAEWTQIEPGNQHPQVGHEIMWIAPKVETTPDGKIGWHDIKPPTEQPY